MSKAKESESETLHRICKPLTMIRGYVSLIQEGDFGKTSEKVSEILEIVMQSTKNLETEVRSLVKRSK
jgi:signal transduction histidine kinase